MLKSHYSWCVLFALLPICGCARCEGASTAAATQPTITADLLNRVPVIGKLGLPLGTSVEIGATVFAGSELGTKSAEFRYFLRVTEVGGKPLRNPELMEFGRAPGPMVKLAPNQFELLKMRNATKAEPLYSVQIKQLEEGYVGKRVHLMVYETGWFDGVPNGTFATWQDHSFKFSTSLVVLYEK